MPSRNIQDSVFAGTYHTIYAGDVPIPYSHIEHADVSSLYWGGVGHYGYPDFPTARDIGGDFGLSYNRVWNGVCDVGTIQGGNVYRQHRYTGNVFIITPDQWTLPTPSGDGSSFGATAYSKMKPDKPDMNGLNAIYELKDLPGMIRQRFHAKNLQEIGDYYLAEKFGWEALLKDVRSFVITHIQAQDRLKQILRDEGRPVKRRIILNDSTSINWQDSGVGTYLGPQFVTYFYAGPQRWNNVLSRSDKVWAAARFRYWLAPGPRDVEWTNALKAKIFGFKPTPAVVYRAIPWTWLADWCTNVGDMIDNLETTVVDRLAADYFYVMRQIEDEYKFTCSTTYYRVDTMELVPASASGRRIRGVKTRLRGDPFGYGTQEANLNGTKLSILGALGLSRIR